MQENKINLGHIRTVANTERRFGSKTSYYALYIKFNGKITPILLTADELDIAISRAIVNAEDLPKVKLSVVKRFLNWLN